MRCRDSQADDLDVVGSRTWTSKPWGCTILDVTGGSEDAIRAAALAWVERHSAGGTVPLTRTQLAEDFVVDDRRFPLVDRGRGIRRPQGWSAALSIMTAATRAGRPRPYEDDQGPDGLHRYKLRRDPGGERENLGLRNAMLEQTPVLWFYGIQPGLFQVISPVYLIDEEAAAAQFVLALAEEQRGVQPGSRLEENFRRYLAAITKRRLHQPLFASQVMVAYETRCAVCSLGHRELLDAAHIVPDSHPHGEPVVPNGLALCKIHHAAFDRQILGIRPDYVVEIHQRLLEEIDGPMLLHGLQDHHGQRLMRVPTRRADRPDRTRLEERYKAFRAA